MIYGMLLTNNGGSFCLVGRIIYDIWIAADKQLIRKSEFVAFKMKSFICLNFSYMVQTKSLKESWLMELYGEGC